jgi:uncharacterized protein with PIN domain
LEAKTQISISVKEIYDKLCPECKAKIRELIKEKITDKMVSGVIGEKQ